MIGFAFAAYGVIAYALFMAVFLYAVGFLGDLPLPRTLDTGETSPLAWAVAIDIRLLGIFAVQHSGMARRAFKRWWMRIVPEPIERATYVLFSSLALALLCWQWRPIAGTVWTVTNPLGAFVLHAGFWLGWLLALFSTFLINHFELFGLQQVHARLRQRALPPPVFRTPCFYKQVRHPLYLGFLLAFWSTPTMTLGHLLFAAVMTFYILIAIQLEERDLIALFGKEYRHYRQLVPMLIPLGRWRIKEAPPSPDPRFDWLQ